MHANSCPDLREACVVDLSKPALFGPAPSQNRMAWSALGSLCLTYISVSIFCTFNQ